MLKTEKMSPTEAFALLLLLLVAGGSGEFPAKLVADEGGTSRKLKKEKRADCKKRRSDWRQYVKDVWTEPDCYEFRYFRAFRGPPAMRGPYTVRVVNGAIESLDPKPADGQTSRSLNVPTMADLLKRTRKDCVSRCMKEGADSCPVTYGEYGDIQSLYIDYSRFTADEEYSVQISNFKICDN